MLSKVEKTIVVSGFESEKIKSEINKINNGSIKIIYNPNYSEGGMSSSIKAGLREILIAKSQKVEAILITPADIPFIPTDVFNQLIDYYNITKPKLMIPSIRGRKGHPIMIDSELFNDVFKISEENKGLKGLISSLRDEIKFLETNSPEILYDIDTLEDIRALNSSGFTFYRE